MLRRPCARTASGPSRAMTRGVACSLDSRFVRACGALIVWARLDMANPICVGPEAKNGSLSSPLGVAMIQTAHLFLAASV